MIYAYLRVSSPKQSVENQYFEIQKWCKQKGLEPSLYVREQASGLINPRARKLGRIMSRAQRGDVLIISEISRLGRSILQIMNVLHHCMEKGMIIYSIKENYELGDNLQSKLLAFAFGLSAEIERHLISQRTKEALQRLKSEGKRLGRPHGDAPLQSLKLYPHRDTIYAMRQRRTPLSHIAKHLGVNRATLSRFLERLEDTERN